MEAKHTPRCPFCGADKGHRVGCAMAAALQRGAVYTPGIGWQTVDSRGRHGNYETEAEARAAIAKATGSAK